MSIKDGECGFLDDIVTVNEDPSWNPMVVSTSSDKEEKQGRELEQDVYTLFFLSNPSSKPFFYSTTVITFQYLVYLLILVDMLVNDDPYKGTSLLSLLEEWRLEELRRCVFRNLLGYFGGECFAYSVFPCSVQTKTTGSVSLPMWMSPS